MAKNQSSFKPGDPRKSKAGRKKGVPNKSTLKFRERLETNKVDIEVELAKAILAKDIDLIKALSLLLPYLTPRMKEQEANPPVQPTPIHSEISTDTVLKLIDGQTTA